MRHDLLIRGGLVIDGSGSPRVAADVAIDGDAITAMGRLDDATAATEIDARGRIVAPGFIDGHTHPDEYIRSKDAKERVNAVTLPRLMWMGLRDNIDPAIAAISVLLILVTVTVLLARGAVRRVLAARRRRSAAEAA